MRFYVELTAEIRGDRLRFVDAMKEATEMKLQNHMQDFKQQLSKEVVGMEDELADILTMRYMIKIRGQEGAGEQSSYSA